MDGVLFDSMPNHAKAWCKAFNELGVEFSPYDAYMREGMTGAATIREVFTMRLGRNATEEECAKLYEIKSQYFEQLPQPQVIADVSAVLDEIKSNGVEIFLVTGSGQHSLLDKLNHFFPNIFYKERMVTAFDVKKGKPDPEPYLMALGKGGLKANEAVVIENAPLGVKSAHRAGIFTVGVNTGILEDEELSGNGADVVYHNMLELLEELPYFFSKINN